MSNMVESKFGKSVSKSVGRAKEKILQNLGKVDRTADEIFDEHVTNFNKQQCAATRLQKELNNYIRCIRACAGASRALLEAVSEVYEPEWGGKELLTINSQSSEILWNDFAHRLAEQVLIPLNTYQGQFPEMRKKIEKRGRKLVDYDGERHALQALQSNPRRAEAKLARQRENLEAAKRTYEVLNSELHEELPGLYGSRIVFLVSAMSTLFASENIFHSEASKVYADLEGTVERLSKESAKGALTFKAPSNAILNNSDSPKDDGKSAEAISSSSRTSSSSPSPNSNNSSKPIETHPSSPSSSSTPTTATTPTAERQSSESVNTTNGNSGDQHLYVNVHNSGPSTTAPTTTTTSTTTTPTDKTTSNNTSETTPRTTMTNNINENQTSNSNGIEPVLITNGIGKSRSSEGPHEERNKNENENENANHTDPLPPTPSSPSTKSENDKTPSAPLHGILNNHGGAPPPLPPHGNGDVTDSNANPNNPDKNNTSNKSSSEPASNIPGVLYRVRATYRYQKEDVDELSFEAGEIIAVIEYDDPEEQEEGWLMGVKDNGEKGMFPANFTRPL